MVQLNKNFVNLEKNYLFVNIQNKVDEYKLKNPCSNLIRLGIGDVTLPICSCITDAMHKAVDEMANVNTFKGYGPHEGYDFLRKAISNKYKKYNVEIDIDEIFVSDGAKSDTSGILDIFERGQNILIPNPTYPVYVDSSLMCGHKIYYMDALKQNNFLPLPDIELKSDIIYICSPNNPTGAVYNREQLKKWVDYAIQNESVILFDAAYEAFIENEDLPHSIYEIEGAKKCAIEICSFSKSAGFTGIRCGYMIIPSAINSSKVSNMWRRRQASKFNGVSYITQRAAFAALSEKGQEQISKSISYYKKNSSLISSTLNDVGIWNIGAKNSPYVWMKCPNNMTSWQFFDYLLDEINIVGTPGSGFGCNGEGFFRLSAFGNYEKILEATERIKTLKF